MAVRFRYRSSPRSESLDLGGAASVSVRDLRARILGPALRRHFDLVISDAASNRPLEDDALLVPAGSDLVVKRVPIASPSPGGGGSSVPRHTAEEEEGKQGCGGGGGEGIESLLPRLDGFDEPGDVDFLGLESELPGSFAGDVKLEEISSKRSSEMSFPRYLDIDGSCLSQAMLKETVMDNSTEELHLEEGNREIKTNTKDGEYKKMEQNVIKSSQVIPNMDAPAELRCFLCKTIFEDAVMIPCCQHSFCKKCIVSALAEMKTCPKCSSSKCTINDLLPNLSLRKAINHFLETEPTGAAGFDDSGPMYAPDVESGIESKEASCAPSIHQQEQQLPCSPSVTGKDSNQTMTSPAKEIKRSSSIKIHLDGNKPTETAPAFNRTTPQEASRSVDFQGSASSSKVYHDIAHKSDDSPIMEAKTLGLNSRDRSGFIAPAIRARKGGRTCYKCGSPDHLIRDCPVASNVNSEHNAFPGDAYGGPNWQGSMFHPLQPYGNMYGTPGMIPFDPGAVPPFGMPSYMSSFYGGMRNPYTFMGMGGMPSPVLPGAQQASSRTGYVGIHDNVKTHKVPGRRGSRDYDYDSGSEDFHDDGRGTSHKHHQTEKSSERHDFHDEDGRGTSNKRHQTEKSERHYDEGSTRIKKRHRMDESSSPIREKHSYSSDGKLVDQKYRSKFDSYGTKRKNRCSEQSVSDLHDMSDNSIEGTKQRSKQHYTSASGRREEIRAKHEGDYSQNAHHQHHKEKSYTDRVDDRDRSSKNTYRHKHRDRETDHSSDYKHDSKLKVSSQSSRHTKTKMGSSDSLLESHRRDKVDGSDDYQRRSQYHHKRKGTH